MPEASCRKMHIEVTVRCCNDDSLWLVDAEQSLFQFLHIWQLQMLNELDESYCNRLVISGQIVHLL